MTYTLYLDLETYCETPIKHGTHAYAEKAEVMIATWAWNDDPVQTWDFTDPELPVTVRDLQLLVDKADEVVIQNSTFDRTVLAHQGVTIPVEKIDDTMVVALAHSLPASLGGLCEVFKVPTDLAKSKEGRRLILLFCKPRPKNVKIRRATRLTHPEDWALFLEYAGSDITAMRVIRPQLPRWNWRPENKRLWVLDQIMNDRGILVDVDMAEAALRANERAQQALAARMDDLTAGVVNTATKNSALTKWLADMHEFPMANLQKGYINETLGDDNIPLEVREALTIRLQAAATAPAKYTVVINGASSDNRLRGTIQFCGAGRTSRDAGRVFQPQNLPRPTLKNDVIEQGIAAMLLNVEDLIFPNVTELLISACRGVVIAPPGKKLVISDLSNIEGRVLTCLAGEEWKVKAFADFDAGKGHDLYKIGAGRILGKDPADVTRDERQVMGKVPELACGYQGAVGAFATMGALYGVNLPEEEVIAIVKGWRANHPKTVAMWYAMERACIDASNNPGETFTVGVIKVRCDGPWLRVRVPSGDCLTYCQPQVGYEEVKREDGSIWRRAKLSIMGVHPLTRQWARLPMYGGQIVENIVQKVARDILFAAIEPAEAAGYAIVLRVHDELVTEMPDSPEYTHQKLSAIMSRELPWTKGWPLAAAGFETYRYRKE